MALDKTTERPTSLPELAADKALDAAGRYLREHGRENVQTIVLLEMSGDRGQEVTGATAVRGSSLPESEPPEIVALHALLTHARMLLKGMDGPPVTPELLAELLNL